MKINKNIEDFFRRLDSQKTAELTPYQSSLPLDIGESGEFASTEGWGYLKSNIDDQLYEIKNLSDGLLTHNDPEYIKQVVKLIQEECIDIKSMLDLLFEQSLAMKESRK